MAAQLPMMLVATQMILWPRQVMMLPLAALLVLNLPLMLFPACSLSAKTIKAGFPVLIAELDGQIAGYAYAGPFHHRAAYGGTVEDSIYVDHRLPRRGVGRALLTELLEQLRAAEFQQVMAVIGDSANAGSIELHRALGFRHVGTARGIGFKFGEYLDVVYMQLALQPETADG